MTINFPFTAINCLVNISEITGSFQFCTSHRNSEGLTAHCTTIFHGMPLKWPKKWLSVTHCTIFLATETGCLRSDTQIHEWNTRTQSMFALWQNIHRLQIFCAKVLFPYGTWRYPWRAYSLQLRYNEQLRLRCFYQFSKSQQKNKHIFHIKHILNAFQRTIFHVYSHRTSHIIDLYSNSSIEIKIVYLRCRYHTVIILHFSASIRFSIQKLCVNHIIDRVNLFDIFPSMFAQY